MVGIIAMRKPQHISLFFVKGNRRHRKALGYADETSIQRPRKKMGDIVEYRLQICKLSFTKRL